MSDWCNQGSCQYCRYSVYRDGLMCSLSKRPVTPADTCAEFEREPGSDDDAL
jgi:hypothetical protein